MKASNILIETKKTPKFLILASQDRSCLTKHMTLLVELWGPSMEKLEGRDSFKSISFSGIEYLDPLIKLDV
ncbi:hypothetical protein ACE6H2_020751 [Prunus campanulata]